MINEYLKSKLRARIDEEAKDSETYKILAEEASEQDCPMLQHYLMVIAEEEKTHETFIKEYLAEIAKKSERK